MHLVYHVAAIDETAGVMLATRTPAGWLLPTLVTREDVPMARVFELAVASVPLPAAPRCLARMQIDPAAGSANATIVIDIEQPQSKTAHPFAGTAQLVPLSDLTAGKPVLAYQTDTVQWLVSQALAVDRPAPLGPHWIRDVAAWVAEVTDSSVASVLDTAQILRADDESAVVRCCPTGEPLHFKGRTHSPFVEALAARLIASHVGGLVAPTRAFDPDRGWRLASHVDGVPLEASCWPAHLSATDAWLRLQRALQPFSTDLEAVGVPHLSPLRLRAAAVHALQAAAIEPEWGGSRSRHTNHVLERVDTLLASPLLVDVPSLLLHFDLAPRNILHTATGVVFLDLDSLHLGPGVIAGALMARRMKDVLTADQRQQLTVHASRALLGAIGRSDLEAHLADVAALTDLALLAMRRSQLWSADVSTIDEATRGYTWRHNAADFLARASAWPAPPLSNTRRR